ncbi:MAG TPA: hypothetical protein VHB77_04610, partial [Planctomycetaceae bacterium]|nr:hypothetical protein [Planctomycetaceae bacterium]
MTIELSCPHCQKLLRTTDDKAGQTAKCPGCGELITIPEPPELYEPVAEEEQVTIADEEGDVDDGADRKPCPLCGGMIRRTARKCRFCGEQIGTAPAQFERDDKSKSLELGDVIQASWERYKEHMGLAVGCLFLAVIIQYIPFIGVMVAANVLDHGGPELQPIAAVAFVALLLLGIGVMLFLSCGVVRVMLKIAKDDDPRFADLFSIHLPTIGSLFVANLISTVCIAVGMFFCIVPGIYLSLLWMPLPFVI